MSGIGGGAAIPAVPAKEDPATLVLRGSPRPAVRFRRGLIVGIAAAVSAFLLALAWAALEPPDFGLRSGEAENRESLQKPPPDALAKAPASYGEVPRLGPPLPGDLGRPILDRRRALGDEAGPMPADAPASDADRARAAAEAERQRLAAAREGARSSAVLVHLARTSNASGRLPADGQAPTDGQAPEGDGRRKPEVAGLDRGGTNAHPLLAAPSPWTLSAGTVIPASLITGLNSDLPGIVLAQVTQHVRDSATGRTVLIPQGARLLGSYDNDLDYGQRRALLVWKRIVFPDASSIRLDNVPATDRSGRSGIQDQVDFHGIRLAKGIALSTLLGVGTELQFGGEDGGLVEAMRRSAQRDAARAGEQMTSRNLDIQPTIRVRPGWPVNAVLNKDLVLRPWKG